MCVTSSPLFYCAACEPDEPVRPRGLYQARNQGFLPNNHLTRELVQVLSYPMTAALSHTGLWGRATEPSSTVRILSKLETDFGQYNRAAGQDTGVGLTKKESCSVPPWSQSKAEVHPAGEALYCFLARFLWVILNHFSAFLKDLLLE